MRKRNPTIDRREEGVPSPVPEVVSDVDNEDEESDRVSYDGEEKISAGDRVESVEKDREEPDCDPLTQTFSGEKYYKMKLSLAYLLKYPQKL